MPVPWVRYFFSEQLRCKPTEPGWEKTGNKNILISIQRPALRYIPSLNGKRAVLFKSICFGSILTFLMCLAKMFVHLTCTSSTVGHLQRCNKQPRCV